MVTVVLTSMFHCSGRISAEANFGIHHRYHWKVVAHHDDTKDSQQPMFAFQVGIPLLWIRID